MNKEIEKILVNIITHELDLPENYGTTSRGDIVPCVVIANQNIKLFNTEKLQITVKTIGCKDYSNRNETKTDSEGNFIEYQYLNQQRQMQIDVYSRNNDARQRFWEVITALKSIYAEQQQDIYNFKIGTITNSRNLSGLDGGSDINRYTITFNVLVHYTKSKVINYYDTFPYEIYTERSENNWKNDNRFSLIDVSGATSEKQGGFSNVSNFNTNYGGFLTNKEIEGDNINDLHLSSAG